MVQKYDNYTLSRTKFCEINVFKKVIGVQS